MDKGDAARYAKRFRQRGVQVTGQYILYGKEVPFTEPVLNIVSSHSSVMDIGDNRELDKTPGQQFVEHVVDFALKAVGRNDISAETVQLLAKKALQAHLDLLAVRDLVEETSARRTQTQAEARRAVPVDEREPKGRRS